MSVTPSLLPSSSPSLPLPLPLPPSPDKKNTEIEDYVSNLVRVNSIDSSLKKEQEKELQEFCIELSKGADSISDSKLEPKQEIEIRDIKNNKHKIDQLLQVRDPIEDNIATRGRIRRYLKDLVQGIRENENDETITGRLNKRIIELLKILNTDLILEGIVGYWEHSTVQLKKNGKGEPPLNCSEIHGIIIKDKKSNAKSFHSLTSAIEYYKGVKGDVKDIPKSDDLQLELSRINKQLQKSIEPSYLYNNVSGNQCGSDQFFDSHDNSRTYRTRHFPPTPPTITPPMTPRPSTDTEKKRRRSPINTRPSTPSGSSRTHTPRTHTPPDTSRTIIPSPSQEDISSRFRPPLGQTEQQGGPQSFDQKPNRMTGMNKDETELREEINAEVMTLETAAKTEIFSCYDGQVVDDAATCVLVAIRTETLADDGSNPLEALRLETSKKENDNLDEFYSGLNKAITTIMRFKDNERQLATYINENTIDIDKIREECKQESFRKKLGFRQNELSIFTTGKSVIVKQNLAIDDDALTDITQKLTEADSLIKFRNFIQNKTEKLNEEGSDRDSIVNEIIRELFGHDSPEEQGLGKWIDLKNELSNPQDPSSLKDLKDVFPEDFNRLRDSILGLTLDQIEKQLKACKTKDDLEELLDEIGADCDESIINKVVEHPGIEKSRPLQVKKTIEDDEIEELFKYYNNKGYPTLFEFLESYGITPNRLTLDQQQEKRKVRGFAKTYQAFYAEKKVFGHVKALNEQNPDYLKKAEFDDMRELNGKRDYATLRKYVEDKFIEFSGEKTFFEDKSSEEITVYLKAFFELCILPSDYFSKGIISDKKCMEKAYLNGICRVPRFLAKGIQLQEDSTTTLSNTISTRLFKSVDYPYLTASKKILDEIVAAFYDKNLIPTSGQIEMVIGILILGDPNKQYGLLAGFGKTEVIDLIPAIAQRLRNKTDFEIEFQVKEKLNGNEIHSTVKLNSLKQDAVKTCIGYEGMMLVYPEFVRFLLIIYGAINITLNNPRSINHKKPLIAMNEPFGSNETFSNKTHKMLTEFKTTLCIHDDADLEKYDKEKTQFVSANTIIRAHKSNIICKEDFEYLMQSYLLKWNKVVSNNLGRTNGINVKDISFKTNKQGPEIWDEMIKGLRGTIDYLKQFEKPNFIIPSSTIFPLQNILGKMESLLELNTIEHVHYEQADIDASEKALGKSIIEQLPAEPVVIKSTIETYTDEKGLMAVLCPFDNTTQLNPGLDRQDALLEKFKFYYENVLPESLKAKRDKFIIKDDQENTYYLIEAKPSKFPPFQITQTPIEHLIEMKDNDDLQYGVLFYYGNQQIGTDMDQLSDNLTGKIPMHVFFEYDNEDINYEFYDYILMLLQYRQRIRNELSPMTVYGFDPNIEHQSIDQILREQFKNLKKLIAKNDIADLSTQVNTLFNKTEFDQLDICTQITILKMLIYSLRSILQESQSLYSGKVSSITQIEDPELSIIGKITQRKVGAIIQGFTKFIDSNNKKQLDIAAESLDKWYQRFTTCLEST